MREGRTSKRMGRPAIIVAEALASDEGDVFGDNFRKSKVKGSSETAQNSIILLQFQFFGFSFQVITSHSTEILIRLKQLDGKVKWASARVPNA